MAVKSNLATGFQECISHFWTHDNFTDFTVVVEGSEFTCHRFILGACSKFFRALLRSGMREVHQNCVQIQNISKETFSTILRTLYTGSETLTMDNMIAVWKGVHQLQIEHLIVECEDFVIKSISTKNYFTIFRHAQLLDSGKVNKHAEEFMLKHFEEIRHTESFLELSFDELYKMIKNDELDVLSEDAVLEAIVKWVSYKPQSKCITQIEGSVAQYETIHHEPVKRGNSPAHSYSEIMQENDLTTTGKVEDTKQEKAEDTVKVEVTSLKLRTEQPDSCVDSVKKELITNVSRQHEENTEMCDRAQFLTKLLSAARLYLTSADCLEAVMKYKDPMKCQDSWAIILDALMYQMKVGRRHSPWPKAALHRKSSSKDHVAIFIDENNKLKAYSLRNNTFHKIADLPSNYEACLALCVFDDILYLYFHGHDDSNSPKTLCSMYTHERHWKLLTIKERSSPVLLSAHGNHLYRYTESSFSLSRRCYNDNGHSNDWYRSIKFDTGMNSMISFQDYIILFSRTNEPNQCYDTKTKTTWELSPVDGPTNHIVSFSSNLATYFIQGTGFLRKIVSTDPTKANFELLARLWDFDMEIYGAVLYRKELFVFGKDPSGSQLLTKLPGIFERITIIAVKSNSQCLPMVVPKFWLK